MTDKIAAGHLAKSQRDLEHFPSSDVGTSQRC